MVRLFKRSSTTLTLSEFYENHILEKYNYNARYQRKSGVWSEDEKSFLIDSILKNYPMPAIFLRPSVNTTTGRTIYDVVDGKQRLQSIVAFIENKIALTSYFAEEDFTGESNIDTARAIAGLRFKEIQNLGSDFSGYVKQFWEYTLNIEYLHEEDIQLVGTVFDRLNRNGKPLTEQELRNARYSNSELLRVIKELASDNFWKYKLSKLKSIRMENEEFISELFFIILENKVLNSSSETINNLYKKYHDKVLELDENKTKFYAVVETLERLELNFFSFRKRLCGKTHLYTVFSFAWKIWKNKIAPEKVKDSVKLFYEEYFSKTEEEFEGYLKDYKDALANRTGSEGNRAKRLNALCNYCKLQDFK